MTNIFILKQFDYLLLVSIKQLDHELEISIT